MNALEQTKYEKLFSTPLLRFRVPEAAALNAALLETGEAMRAETGGVTKSNRGGWHSPGNLFEYDAAPVQSLRAFSEAAVWQANSQVGSAAEPAGFDVKLFAWMNVNPPGGFNAPHTHPGAHWSGVYYVSQPAVETGSSGRIEFLSPRADLPSWRILKAPAFSSKKSIRPEAGELILFPSYLVHWVYPNETEDARVTVAFNATLKKAKPAPA